MVSSGGIQTGGDALDGRPPPAAPSASHTAPASARPDDPSSPVSLRTAHSDHQGRLGARRKNAWGAATGGASRGR
jgi:hypothetical protein